MSDGRDANIESNLLIVRNRGDFEVESLSAIGEDVCSDASEGKTTTNIGVVECNTTNIGLEDAVVDDVCNLE